jgi:phage host-nuclease inhibitor protein Gam
MPKKQKKITPENALLQKLDEISAQVETIKVKALEKGTDLRSELRELDRLVRELKALQGLSAFDKTAYQREYMRKRRALDPEYRPVMRNIKDLSDWRRFM